MRYVLAATFEKGVFVPDESPSIPERKRVRLTVEGIDGEATDSGARLAWRRQHRIRIDPALSEDIALSDELNPEES